ncbi:SRPBCC family protein [Chitinophaga sp. 22321]|uniref:SRPBCC domain-containing protein n=1 Tax=Chitinophaga hostae TaxID=2831022 RepID=A0ABS5IWN0_9BACT|nr:SRPBCC domain-containing protein [Chitinophaga hostae]MBS0027186.1 SRPBCC domain-containing protein [Chitinophaga hostae]
METKIDAGEDKQELIITRAFNLPLDLLFKAHAEPEIIGQWMSHELGTTRVKQENKKFGNWQAETTDPEGNKLFVAVGVMLEFIPNEKITRTFEIENGPFPVQLEFMEFEKLTTHTSKLTMQMIFKSVSIRDQLLKTSFAKGINMAHNRIEKFFSKNQ